MIAFLRLVVVCVAIVVSGAAEACGQCISENAHFTKVHGESPAAWDRFGYSVAISGDTAVVGAIGDDDAGSDSGVAYVFREVDGSWQRTATLRADDASAYDWFGFSVAISGDIIVVGAPYDDEAGTDSGAAYVFVYYEEDDTWHQSAKLTSPYATANELFGHSVAINDVWQLAIVVGAIGTNANGDVGGSVYAYASYDYTGYNWYEIGMIHADDAQPGDNFGYSVAMNESFVVVGVTGDDDAGADSGSVYVYEWFLFGEVAKVIATDTAAGDAFGTSVAVDGLTVLVGADRHDAAGSDSGAAYIFRILDDHLWEEVARLTATDGDAYDRFGASVVFAGHAAIVGAPESGNGASQSKGAAYMFRETDGAWREFAKLTASDGNAYDTFGSSIAASGAAMLIGAHNDDDSATNAGSAYFLNAPYVYSDCNSNGVPDGCDIAGATSADCNGNAISDDCELAGWVGGRLPASVGSMSKRFGYSVAINDDIVVVGSPYQGFGPRTGDAFVYRRIDDVWRQVAKLNASNGVPYDEFGYCVAVSGQTIVVGAPRDEILKGAVYVFREVGPGDWQQVAKLRGDDAGRDALGISVAIDGRLIVAGAYDDDQHRGSTYVFREDTSGIWQQVGKLIPSNAGPDTYFGTSVAISGGTVLVGAEEDSQTEQGSGAAYLFREIGGDWQQVAKLSANDASSYDNFGRSVAIAGNTALVVSDARAPGGGGGWAYVFRDIRGQWQQIAKIRPAGSPSGVSRVRDAALSGGVLAIATTAEPGSVVVPGAVTVFRETGGIWRQDATFIPDESAAAWGYDSSVAVSGETVVVGQFSRYEDINRSGSAYVFSTAHDCNGNGVLDVCDTAADPATDCNVNHVPDACEVVGGAGEDCNANGVVDACDIVAGTDTDCNANGVADTCDLIGGTGTDCNGNLILDECDIASIAGTDCNFNGVPDACDIASGSSSDCNLNDMPDECEFGSFSPGDKLTADDASQGAQFGSGVAVSGNTAIVGAQRDGDGEACVFQRRVSEWSQVTKLRPFDLGDDARFGCSVAFGGDTAIIGASNDNQSRGSAYIYRIIAGTWERHARLEAPSSSYFGASVDIDGDMCVVGAPREYDDRGAAYVFRESNGMWQQIAHLIPNDSHIWQKFGTDVAISGHTVAVGTPSDDDQGSHSGSVYVFRQVGDAWEMSAKLTPADGAERVYFGSSIAIDGRTLVVGTQSGPVRPESAYVFREFAGHWQQDAKLPVAGLMGYSGYGEAVAISDGIIVVGLPAFQTAPGILGSASVYREVGGQWTLIAELAGQGTGPHDSFGYSVAFSGDTVIAGAPADDQAGMASGSAYVFRIDNDCNGNDVLDECDIAGKTSTDCDTNSVPDECDIAIDGALDCNLDGLLDTCFRRGDLDVDGDVDAVDCAAFASCVAGPDRSLGSSCCLSDLDGDGDADLSDFAVFQMRFANGP
ncbi:MAG: hypothetical protein H6817_01560 [Phycisphaerales bacterium]|nr:hypothetical protein [Phycisphaerales bacterium]